MHYAMSVENNHCMRDMKFTIPRHDMPPCFFSNSFMCSTCSVTNWFTSLLVSKPGGFRKSLYPQTCRSQRCASVGKNFFSISGFLEVISGNSAFNLVSNRK